MLISGSNVACVVLRAAGQHVGVWVWIWGGLDYMG